MKQENKQIQWTETLTEEWEKFTKLITCLKKSFMQMNSEKQFGIMTEASEGKWGSNIFQVKPLQKVQEMHFQYLHIQPKMFLPGKFTKSQRKWHISQK